MDDCIVGYRKHDWCPERTIGVCFLILRISNIIVSLSIFLNSFSFASFLILSSSILCFYVHPPVFNTFSIALSIFLICLMENNESIFCWFAFVLTDLIGIPLLRKYAEKLRKCAIWKWDECSICPCYKYS